MTTLLPSRQPGAESTPASAIATAVGEVTVLRCAGDLDLAALPAVSDGVRTALATRPIGLVLDLSGVAFCDTVGLRLLLSTAAKAKAQGCATALAGLQRPVAEFLARVCVDRALPSYADVSAAIEGLMFSGDWR